MSTRGTDRLQFLVDKLRPTRTASAVSEDMFEAADDWRILGTGLDKAEPWDDFRSLGAENERQLNILLTAYGPAIEQNEDYAEIVRIGRRLIAEAKARIPDPNGYLGWKRIIPATFAFLVDEYGFQTTEDSFRTEYTRVDAVISIRFMPIPPTFSPILISDPSKPNTDYYLADILFMADRSAPLGQEPLPDITTEEEAQHLYTAMAQLLRTHCADILNRRPGAMDRLAAAQRLRDQQLSAENERLYGPLDGYL